MKKIVIAYQKDDKKIFYLSPRSPINKPKKKEDELQYRIALNHMCRVKRVLFGHMFAVYHPEMDFTIAEAVGWIKITTNLEDAWAKEGNWVRLHKKLT